MLCQKEGANMRERDRVLDSLKGISILGVILVHSSINTITYYGKWVKVMGATWTVMFLIITSFLSFRSYERSVVLGETSNVKWMLRKVIRIIPLYYLFILLRVITGKELLGFWGSSQATAGNVIAHLLFINNFYPFYSNSLIGVEWYIGVIVFFWIITPLVWKVFNNGAKALFGFVFFSVAHLALIHVCIPVFDRFITSENRYTFDTWIDTWLPINRMGILCLGLVLFFLSKHMMLIQSIKKIDRIILSSVFLVCFAILYIGSILNRINIWGVSPDTRYALMYAFLILGLYIFPNKIMVNSIFCCFGKYSLGIYLCHTLLIHNIERLFNPNEWIINILVNYVGVTVGSLAISVALTRYIEKPPIKVLDRLTIKDVV